MALAAIQALYQMSVEKDKQIAQQNLLIAQLANEVQSLKAQRVPLKRRARRSRR